MAYEFKSLGTVDVVETVTDTANVLIEEDGVIKRAPKSEVGGVKEEFDIDIVANLVSITDDDYNWEFDIIHASSYNDIGAKLEMGIEPKGRIMFNSMSCSNERTDGYHLYEIVAFGANRGWEYWQEYGQIIWGSYSCGMFGATIYFNEDNSTYIEAFFD